MKKDVPLNQAHRLLNTGCVVLVTSAFETSVNVMSLAWQTPLSGQPTLAGISVAHPHFTHELIMKSREFAINIPGWELLEQVKFCGKAKGRNTDKFAESGLTPVSASKISAPLAEQCLGHIECRVAQHITVGDHTLFIGEVLAASAREDKFNGYWNADASLIHHLGGTNYYSPGNRT